MRLLFLWQVVHLILKRVRNGMLNKKDNVRLPPVRKPNMVLQLRENPAFIDYIPPVEAYVIDAIYSD